MLGIHLRAGAIALAVAAAQLAACSTNHGDDDDNIWITLGADYSNADVHLLVATDRSYFYTVYPVPADGTAKEYDGTVDAEWARRFDEMTTRDLQWAFEVDYNAHDCSTHIPGGRKWYAMVDESDSDGPISIRLCVRPDGPALSPEAQAFKNELDILLDGVLQEHGVEVHPL